MNIALILSGGIGTRLGSDIPKQYIKINNKMIISYCLKTFCESERVDAVQIVADSRWHAEIKETMEQIDGIGKFIGFSAPGKTRQLSIYNGLCDIRKNVPDENVFVIIHDAARPLITNRFIDECFDNVLGHDGVIPVLPMKDTVYASTDGKVITSLLDRHQIFAGQSPEVFELNQYIKANEALMPDKILSINGSTEPAVLYGMDVARIPGDEANFKITTREDIKRFEKIVGGNQ